MVASQSSENRSQNEIRSLVIITPLVFLFFFQKTRKFKSEINYATFDFKKKNKTYFNLKSIIA